MRPLLFSPLTIGPVELPNRIAIAPMCQYSAHDGCAEDWHLQHWMNLAMSGAGLVTIEATAVERRGRITHGCVGLFDDGTERTMKRGLDAARAVALPGTKFAVQLAHAGRKASSRRPWENGQALGPTEDPWHTVSASAVPFSDGWHTPEALDEAGIERIIKAFADSAVRAERLGIEVIELHMTHGYLVHQFFSPVSNKRTDRWGGSYENRARFGLAIAEAVKAAVGPQTAVGARITGSDWMAEGIAVEDAVRFASDLKARGIDFACVSSGGIDPKARINVGPGYQVAFASEVKRRSGIVTRAVGMIVTAKQAEEILQAGDADQIALGRAILDNPRWGWHAADELGIDFPRPLQYDRARPKVWPGAALAREI
jgi:2,4-dienoyl-CoA reductase-like NADH-dependent reductase (Old Yellow Enzyme family)